MRSTLALFGFGAALAIVPGAAQAQNLLTNGNLDRVHDVEIVPGFFLPKPDVWENVGTRLLTGPYEDEMSSEPWAGPAPTPVTADGLANPPPYNANPDYGVFFKGFTGNFDNGPATGHLYQDVPGTPGVRYSLTGWAGAEANYFGGAVFALDFLNGGGGVISSAVLDLIAAGLFVDNGQAFDYKQYEVAAIAPAGTAFVRARASMIDAAVNPAGGGQAYVVDDFVLVPEPTTALAMLLLGAAAFARRR
jgi:hypothetical protein